MIGGIDHKIKTTTMKIKIFSSDIDNLHSLFNDYFKHYLELDSLGDETFLIEEIKNTEEVIYLQNKRIERYVNHFQNLTSIKNDIVNLKTKKNELLEQMKLTEFLLNSLEGINNYDEIVNPYFLILDSEFVRLNNLIKAFEQRVIVIYFPNAEDVLIHLESKSSKLKAAQIICSYIKEMSEEDTDLIPEEYLDKTDLEFLEFLKIPLQREIRNHNEIVSNSLENHLLEESWFIKYKKIFKIENIQSLISQEKVFLKVYDLISHQIKDDSIEIIEFSTDEITGEDIHPNTPNLEIILRRKLLEIFESELGIIQDNEFVQRAYELSNGEVEIELISFSFPESDKLTGNNLISH